MNTDFALRLLDWFDVHGRHDLPWQHPRDPYRVWLSEVMLQQTQVATVIPYFERFIARFPDINALAQAPVDEVLRHWAGLGYYARARNLHRAAQVLAQQHRGEFPDHFDAVAALPGVGRSTAGAILAQAFDQPLAILDGNVRRVLARHAGIDGWPGLPRVQQQLWTIAQARMPARRCADYTQAVMDLGSLVCRARQPQCAQCPVHADCVAQREQRVAQLPAPRPARERPHREAYALLIVNAQHEVLLERRPPAGIWGGLWCVPMSAPGAAWTPRAAELGLDDTACEPLPPFDHAFTHFQLHVQPLRFRTAHTAPGVEESSAQAWIKLDQPHTWPGLPSPIRKWLEALSMQVALPLPLPVDSACHAPSTASSSAALPKASTGRPTPARSASASTTASRRKAGSSGSSTRRG